METLNSSRTSKCAFTRSRSLTKSNPSQIESKSKVPVKSGSQLAHRIESLAKSSLVPLLPNGLNTRCLVALSGGLDSITLLHIATKLNIPLTIAHVNYHTRGQDSDLDEELVRSVAQKYNLDLKVLHANPADLKKGNFQNNARNLRRQFFLTTGHHIGASVTLLGHHRDDQIETIVSRWFRGAGPSALTGMQKKSVIEGIGGNVGGNESESVSEIKGLSGSESDNENLKKNEHFFIRPLLDIPRADLLAYAQHENLIWREDVSNSSNSYARNWLRNVFSEVLSKHFPGWEANVLKQAYRATSTDELTSYVLKTIAKKANSLEIERLSVFSDTTQKMILHKWVGSFGCSPSEGEIESLFGLLSSQKGAQLTFSVSPDFIIVRESDALVLNSNAERGELNASFQPVSIPLQSLTKSPVLLSTSFAKIEVKSADTPREFDPQSLYLDTNTLGESIILRTWQDSDRIQPLGMKGTKLVSDHLTDLKISSAEKKQAIVVTSFDEKLCAVIFPHRTKKGLWGCISETHKVAPSTRSVIEIQIKHRK
jgi:tRNA(Ile)-lysidine synthase